MSHIAFNLKTLIIRSNHTDYQEGKNKKISIIKKIGEGSYGLVFLLDNEHVIKIFKNSTTTNTIFEESNYLIPIKNENRELIFFFKYKNQKKDYHYLINLYAIGIIKDKIIDNKNFMDINTYFIILPLCIPFYNVYDIWNQSLINVKNGINFTLSVMNRLLELSQYLETKYEYINLDFKLNNFMFSKNSKDLNDLIMIDFSILKKKVKNKKYNIDRKYYIWPTGNNIIIENIPAYSISINGLELLFGHNKLIDFPNENKITNFLKILLEKNKNLYHIFYNALYLKINTDNLIKLIKNYH